MADTLGSLIDKLSIKNLRIWHIGEELKSGKLFEKQAKELRDKKELAQRQKEELIEEINGFLALALEKKIRVRDQKLKLYQNLNVANLEDLEGLGGAVSELSIRNINY